MSKARDLASGQNGVRGTIRIYGYNNGA
jgi:hypothetical protein